MESDFVNVLECFEMNLDGLTWKSSKSSTAGPREPWLNRGS